MPAVLFLTKGLRMAALAFVLFFFVFALPPISSSSRRAAFTRAVVAMVLTSPNAVRTATDDISG